MDTVISNKYSSVLNELDIEVSKKLEGEYTVDEIISQFKNFFFNKMFLDITAIKDYKDLTNLQKLSMSIDMDKVILLLDKDDSISDSEPFLAKLVNMGIYNFTKDQNNLMYLYTNPNIYRDVAYLQKIDTGENNNTTTDSSHSVSNKRIIGIKNITDSAGATSLIYMLKKVLSSYYSVMVLEVNKRDFTYFKDNDALTVKEDEISNVMDKYNNIDIFLLDLNKSNKDYLCTDVLYLIEPSILKLNKLAMLNPKLINDIKGKMVVLNKSVLSKSEQADFEVETGIKVFYNIPPLNDKKDNSDILLPLLEKLGYIKKEEEQEKKKSIFDFLKFK
ncbi:MAG TPA: hypothetical protein OIM64_02180 [Bacilli bacterium]|nr:hypothetical protein [Bacilli bacterium]